MNVAQFKANVSANVWHDRLKHLNPGVMMKLNYIADGYKVNKCNVNPCEVCLKGKQNRESFMESKNRATQLLQLVSVAPWKLHPSMEADIF